MALKKFNYKLKENKKKPLIISGIIVLVLLVGVTIYNTYAAYKATTSYNILQGEIEFFEKRDLTIAVKLIDIEGNIEYAEDFPTEGYAFNPVKSYCVNGAKISYSNGSANITEVKGKDKCTLYFSEYGALAQAIFTNNTLVTTTPDFSQVATDVNTNLYQTEDDFGTSYYFRGATSNNYVQFGSYAAGTTINVYDQITGGNTAVTFAEETPMYWRIVRINGDGTIRLAYDGTTKAETATVHIATVGASAYNDEEQLNLNYGDSGIKGLIDTWYNTHLKTNYGSYIADAIFCNDKVITQERYFSADGEEITDSAAAELTDFYYAPYKRLVENKTPKLTCTRVEDRYTTQTSLGNGLLSHPVGLLTADEMAFVGYVINENNLTNYLYSGDYFWTSSPLWSAQSGPVGMVERVERGTLVELGTGVEGVYGARPVINLRADVDYVGNGSFETPFVIQTN